MEGEQSGITSLISQSWTTLNKKMMKMMSKKAKLRTNSTLCDALALSLSFSPSLCYKIAIINKIKTSEKSILRF